MDDEINLTPTGHEIRTRAKKTDHAPILQHFTVRVVPVDRPSRKQDLTRALPNEVVFSNESTTEIPYNGTSSYSELGVDGMSPPKAKKAPTRFTFDMIPSKSYAESLCEGEEPEDEEMCDDSNRILYDLWSLQEERLSTSGSTAVGLQSPILQTAIEDPVSMQKCNDEHENDTSIEFTRTKHLRVCQNNDEYKTFFPLPSWEKDKSRVEAVQEKSASNSPSKQDLKRPCKEQDHLDSPLSSGKKNETEESPRECIEEVKNEDHVDEAVVDNQRTTESWFDFGWLAWW